MIEKKPFNIIETERLILKPHEATFEYAIMVYNLIKENWNFLTRFLDKMLNIKRPEDEYAFFVDCDKKWKDMIAPAYGIWTKEGLFIGTCDFHSVDYDLQSAEMGYCLMEKYIGKGYMTEAVRALENEFFNRGFNRLVIIMDTENTASEKVAIRCGYTKEGTMREWHYNPTFKSCRNMFLYSKLKSERER